jgi:prophage regulatory protein
LEDLSDYVPEKVIDVGAVCWRVVFTRQHIDNLVKSGEFPTGFYLGPRCHVWALKDVLAWMQQKLDERVGAVPIVITDKDRFLSKKEMREVIPYTPNYLLELEREGMFPLRVILGQKRVGWLQREVVRWMAAKKRAVDSR